jgi:hypothetical protein
VGVPVVADATVAFNVTLAPGVTGAVVALMELVVPAFVIVSVPSITLGW